MNFHRLSAIFAGAFLLTTICLFPLHANGQVEAEPDLNQLVFDKDTWHVSASPYLWLAGLDGNLTLAGHDHNQHVHPDARAGV